MTIARTAGSRLGSIPVSRLVATAALVLVASLYVSPVQKYLRVERQLDTQRHELARVTQRNAALEREKGLLENDSRVIELARACGWIFPGERALVVEGLPTGDELACR